jgi:glycerol-3-phosphate acyltransferase PlsY
VSEELLLAQKLLAAIVVGYLLGSLPLAHVMASRRGIDIFATGSTRAGTANVFWNISRRRGILVFAGDAIKGFLSVQFASLLGVPDSALILAGGAAVAGHWKSIFTRFRGGDGMVTLVGVTFALVPVLSLIGITLGVATVLLTRRSPFRSSMGVTVCFGVMMVISQTVPYYDGERLDGDPLAVMMVISQTVPYYDGERLDGDPLAVMELSIVALLVIPQRLYSPTSGARDRRTNG